MTMKRVAEGGVGVDLVAVARSNPNAAQAAVLLELAHDPVRRAFADPDRARDFAQRQIRLPRDRRQHMHVVAEEQPVGHVVDIGDDADDMNPASDARADAGVYEPGVMS